MTTQDILYGIVGIDYPAHDTSPSPFGGYFRFDPSTKSIEGKLVDHKGSSEIRGKLEGEKIHFTKIYSGKEDIIDYEFERMFDSWSGLFASVTQKTHLGLAQCTLYPKI